MPLPSLNFPALPMIRLCRAPLICIGYAMSILLLASVTSADPYCDPSDSDCLVTTEILVDHPVRQRLEVPLPLAEVEVDGMALWTDSDGVLQALCNTSDCLAKLAQAGVRVEDQCSGSSGVSRFSLSGERPTYPCGTDCAEPGNTYGIGNTWPSRTAFHWVEQSIRKAKLYLDPTKIPSVTVETNHTAATHSSGIHMLCAGFWDASSKTIELFQSGGECGNSGETTIVAHEWAHALYRELYPAEGPWPIDETTNEALADVHAALVSGDTCIGRGIRLGQRCTNCRLGCDGLRDLEAFSLWSSKPAKKETIFDPEGMACPQGPGRLGAAPHCESLIASTAFMDLVKLLQMEDEDLGTQTAEKLFYRSLSRLFLAYRSVGSLTTGCHLGSWYNALLEADDALYGDSNVQNGTPHGCLIYQAFEAHGIACNQPLICSRLITAGPDQETCKGSPVSIGPPAPPSHTISWQHGTPNSPVTGSPVSVVSQTLGLQTYTMKAQDQINLEVSTDEVRVRNFDCEAAFFDNFEGGPLPNWEMTGLWHHIARGIDDCLVATTGAMYFGLDTCTYENCRSVYGDLISDVISVPATSPPGRVPALTFLSQRDVEKHSDPITTDRSEVWIEEWPKTPTSGADLRWARSSAIELETCGPTPANCPPPSVPQPPWHPESVGPISLQPYAGKDIRVRFHFNSLDAANNNYTGWLIDNVEVNQFSDQDVPSWLVPPNLTLISPGDGDVLPCCKCATFEASAIDALGNDISDQVVWTSNINGQLGSGRGIRMVLSPTLPLGQDPSPEDERQEYHTITASVIDQAGQSASLNFLLRVPDDGQECVLLKKDPAERRQNCAGMGDR